MPEIIRNDNVILKICYKWTGYLTVCFPFCDVWFVSSCARHNL